MGKVYIAGEGSLHSIKSVEDLKKLGYISAVKANERILFNLCDNSYKNGGLEKFKKYSKMMSEQLDKVQFGIGKSTRFYYHKNEVKGFINKILYNETHSLEEAKNENLLSNVEDLVSGTVVGKYLWNTLLEINPQTAGQRHQIEFAKLRKNVHAIKVGSGKATCYLYNKLEVKKYINDEVLKNK